MAHLDSEVKEECLREDLKFYFMNPCEKFRARQQIPWKMGLQILKIVMVTTQVNYIISSFVLFLFFKNFIYLFIYLWLCCVFISLRGLSPVVASGGPSSSRCAGLSLSRPLLLQSTGSRRAGSVIVAHGPSRSAACGIFPDQGSNPCPLHWQADSQPLRHQGSPSSLIFNCRIVY